MADKEKGLTETLTAATAAIPEGRQECRRIGKHSFPSGDSQPAGTAERCPRCGVLRSALKHGRGYRYEFPPEIPAEGGAS